MVAGGEFGDSEAMPGWPVSSDTSGTDLQDDEIRSFLHDCVLELGVDTVEFLAELIWVAGRVRMSP